MADAGRQRRPRGDLTQGNIGPTLLKFALPTLASSILQSLNGTINAIWVGRFLGENALAATSNANMVMFLLSAFVFGFGMASTILIGQAWGRKDLEGARRVFGTAMGGFLLVSIGIAAVGYSLAPQILKVLATPPEATPLALAYLRVIFIAMPALLLLTLAMMALRGAGDSLTPLWFMIVAVALIGLIIFVYAKDLALRLRGRELGFLIPAGGILKTLFIKGLPMGIQMIVISMSALALVGLVNHEGVDTTAAFGVAMQLWTYVQMPAMALGAAVSAMVAQNIGAGHWERVNRVTRIGIVQSLLITGALIVLMTIADRAVLGLFMGPHSPALPIARHIHLVATWNFLLFGVMMVLFATVRANGAVWAPLIILAVGLVGVRFAWIFATTSWLGADALWTSFPVTSLVNLALATGYYLRGGWKKARMVEAQRPSEDECCEDALATREPGGALNPAG